MIQAASVQRVFASGAFLCGLWGGHWQAPAAPRFQHSDSGSIFRGNFQTLAGTKAGNFQTFSVSICLAAFPSIHILPSGIGEYWLVTMIYRYIYLLLFQTSAWFGKDDLCIRYSPKANDKKWKHLESRKWQVHQASSALCQADALDLRPLRMGWARISTMTS